MLTILIVGAVVSGFGLVAAAGAYQKQQIAEANERLRRQAQAMGLDFVDGEVVLERHGRRVTARNHGKDSAWTWTLRVDGIALADKTTLSLRPQVAVFDIDIPSFERDILVGDPELDRLLYISGSSPDFVRAVLADAEVLQAVRARFRVEDGKLSTAVGATIGFRLDGRGTLTVRVRREAYAVDTNLGEAQAHLEDVLALATLLDRAARLPPRASIDEQGVGSSSGAPVAGVRIT
jgi:hypothetical protein